MPQPTDWVLILPVLTVFAASLLVLGSDLVLPPRQSGWLFLPALGGLVLALVLTLTGAGGGPGFQQTVTADAPTRAVLAIILAAAIAGLLLASLQLPSGERVAGFLGLYLWASTGMMLLAQATSLLTLFLGLEILSLALYALTAFAQDRRGVEAGLKYLITGATASGILLYGLALLYGASGDTRLLPVPAHPVQQSMLLVVGAGLTLPAVAFKLGLVPFHFWIPDVYQGAPTAITAFMSVGTKAAAFLALARLTALLPAAVWQPLLAGLAVLTMLVGALGALRQRDLKRLLAYSGLAHAGYLLVALLGQGPRPLVTGIFYLAAYAVVNLGAFAAVAWLEASEGSASLQQMAALGRRAPWLTGALALFLLGLASFPPLAGFSGKLLLLVDSLSGGRIALAFALVLATALSALAYLRPLALTLAAPTENDSPQQTPLAPLARAAAWVVMLAMAWGTAQLGVAPGSLIVWLNRGF